MYNRIIKSMDAIHAAVHGSIALHKYNWSDKWSGQSTRYFWRTYKEHDRGEDVMIVEYRKFYHKDTGDVAYVMRGRLGVMFMKNRKLYDDNDRPRKFDFNYVFYNGTARPKSKMEKNDYVSFEPW